MNELIQRFPGILPRWGENDIIVLRYKGTSLYAMGNTKDTSKNNYVTYDLKSDHNRRETGLGLWQSIPIAGCDLLSSCLFTTGGCALRAGKLTPIGLGLVTFMLYFFRKVYSEIVTAIPNNGGCYNAFLNTSPKILAGMVSCLSILSYVATALVAAYDAILYLDLLWTEVDYRAATIVVLGLFAALNILGVKESALACQILFFLHTFTLALFIIWAVVYGFQDNFNTFHENTHTSYPDIFTTEGDLLQTGSVAGAIFYGYSSSLLGITGFESAANYVEEMKENGVYVSTINWMWVFSGLFNPLIGLVVLFVLPMDKIYESSGNLLAVAGEKMGGSGLQTFICVDSILILCGAVLTSYVGCSGLMRRLAQDRLLPEFLLNINIRGTQHWGPISFFLVTSSLFVAIYKPGDESGIEKFGGVFSIAFLSVMALFSLACMALKIQRPDMARMKVCPWWQVIFCFFCVVIGLIGNILLAPSIIPWFILYFVAFSSVVVVMYTRVEVIKQILWLIGNFASNGSEWIETKKSLKLAHDRQEKYGEYEYQEVVRRASGAVSIMDERESPTKSESVQTSKPFEDDLSVLQDIMTHSRVLGPVVDKLLTTLNKIVSNPVVFLAKPNEILSIVEALDYVKFNEQTKHVIVVHIVDDRNLARSDCDGSVSDNVILKQYKKSNEKRKSLARSFHTDEDAEFSILSALNAASPEVVQFCDNVSLLDSFYMYLRVSCLIIRGSYFCPATILWLSQYLQIDTGSMFMGMPGMKFKFPLASFKGVRIILKPKPKQSQQQARARINNIILERSYFEDEKGNMEEAAPIYLARRESSEKRMREAMERIEKERDEEKLKEKEIEKEKEREKEIGRNISKVSIEMVDI